MDEEWRPVPGYEGFYEVSSIGRVRSLARMILTSTGRRFPVMERLLSTFPNGGYPTVRIYKHNRCKTIQVHRLVALTFLGEPPDPSMEVCHQNGVRSDPSLPNLRWDTHTENVRDTVRHGTHHYAGKPTCIRDHLLSGPNLRTTGNGRSCLACNRAQTWVKRHPGSDMQAESDRYYKEIMI